MDTYSELIQGKRGYIVLAPKGSAAFKRIQEGIIYLDPSSYERITKKLRTRINKLTSPVTWYDTLPHFIKKSLKEYDKAQVRRVWRPKPRK